jgi:hypothetical protein
MDLDGRKGGPEGTCHRFFYVLTELSAAGKRSTTRTVPAMSGVAIGASDPSLEGAVVFADESTLLILLRGVRGAASFLPSLDR